MSASTSPLILSIFSTFAVGGPQVRFATIVNHFGQRYRHIVVAMDGIYSCSERLDPKLDVELRPIEHSKGDTLVNRRHFRNLLHSIHPDCLVTHNWGTIEWALANWPRLVRHIHIEDGFGPEEADRQLLRRSLMRRLVLGGSSVIVPSRQLEHIATQTWSLNAASVHFIPNGIDVARFSKTGIKPLFARNETAVVGTVAALRAEKNLHRMLDAFRLIRDQRPCRLLIAGEGPMRAKLEARASDLELGNDVKFAGYQSDPARIYAGLDVFLLSSDTEQMPTSVIEAMAAGLPIVSTNVGDVAAMVAMENASFIVEKNASALAAKTNILLDDDTLRRRLGAANQARAKSEFAQDRMFAAYSAMFDGCF